MRLNFVAHVVHLKYAEKLRRLNFVALVVHLKGAEKLVRLDFVTHAVHLKGAEKAVRLSFVSHVLRAKCVEHVVRLEPAARALGMRGAPLEHHLPIVPGSGIDGAAKEPSYGNTGGNEEEAGRAES